MQHESSERDIAVSWRTDRKRLHRQERRRAPARKEWRQTRDSIDNSKQASQVRHLLVTKSAVRRVDEQTWCCFADKRSKQDDGGTIELRRDRNRHHSKSCPSFNCLSSLCLLTCFNWWWTIASCLGNSYVLSRAHQPRAVASKAKHMWWQVWANLFSQNHKQSDFVLPRSPTLPLIQTDSQTSASISLLRAWDFCCGKKPCQSALLLISHLFFHMFPKPTAIQLMSWWAIIPILPISDVWECRHRQRCWCTVLCDMSVPEWPCQHLHQKVSQPCPWSDDVPLGWCGRESSRMSCHIDP